MEENPKSANLFFNVMNRSSAYVEFHNIISILLFIIKIAGNMNVNEKLVKEGNLARALFSRTGIFEALFKTSWIHKKKWST